MKYVSFEAGFDVLPGCCDNMREALKKIGEKDPKTIGRTTLKRRNKKSKLVLSENDYVNRGVLNVRCCLNGSLKKKGKFTNRMIRKTARICEKTTSDGCMLKTTVPKEDFVRIVEETYKLLYLADQQFCEDLYNKEHNDPYRPKIDNNDKRYISIVPIHTNIIARGVTEVVEAQRVQRIIMEKTI